MSTIYMNRVRRLMETLPAGSLLVLYSGESVPMSLDECYPFKADRDFFYLTGLRRENMALLLLKPAKAGMPEHIRLFIEPPIPRLERWIGKRMPPEQCREISGIADIELIEDLPARIARCVERETVEAAYFDCYRCGFGDADSYNLTKAKQFISAYPAVPVRDGHPLVAEMRRIKDEDEVEKLKAAIDLTDRGLRRVLSNLRPGETEYQAQADFEYTIMHGGADGVSFPTISAGGVNACSLHYATNRESLRDGDLLLMDLGARLNGYCADITRTYPVNGHYTPRQRQLYDIVLEANRLTARTARPGMTLGQLNTVCKDYLAEQLMAIGLIDRPEAVSRYYMHSVSHHLGIDTHDAVPNDHELLVPGCVITDEPGLYVDEEGIGIRIEDDLLITETGCEVLSEMIPRDPDEIEKLMAEANADA